MRVLSAAALVLAFSGAGHAQGDSAPTKVPAGPTASSPFRLFRWDEDWRHMARADERVWFVDRLKHVPLAAEDDAWYVSFGGEVRVRYESLSARAFGTASRRRDDYVLQRHQVHADVHLGERVRVFVQLASGLVAGEDFAKPPNQDDPLDLAQAFADVVLDPSSDATLRLRAGRMEMGYGSYRLVTVRDGTNLRQTFDGARATWRGGATTIDAFVTRPVALEDGTFDDEPDDGQALWGAYGVVELVPQGRLTCDLYYLGLERDDARFQSGQGDELRHSFGSRLSGRADGLDHDTEAVVQFGDFDAPVGEQSIRAWTVASNTGWTWNEADGRPRVGLKANIASGDGDAGDDRLQTFNALFPRINYFSEAALFAPANFFDLQPSLTLRPSATVTLNATWDWFWREDTADGVYGPAGIVVPGNASDERFVGSTLWFQADWVPVRGVALSAAYVHFFAGDVVDDAGGTDVDYIALAASWRF